MNLENVVKNQDARLARMEAMLVQICEHHELEPAPESKVDPLDVKVAQPSQPPAEATPPEEPAAGEFGAEPASPPEPLLPEPDEEDDEDDETKPRGRRRKHH